MGEKNNPISLNRTLLIIILILILFIINIILIIWPVRSLLSLNPNGPYPLIDISRSFIDKEDFIINIQPLRDNLKQIVEREGSDSITLYFEFLNTGANISINPDLKIWPASLSKLPLAMSVMKKIENGTWNLDTQLVLLEEYKNIFSGSLFKNEAGSTFTVEQLLKEMLVNSDNTAYTVLSRNMTNTERRTIIDETGLEELFDDNGRVSGKEYSRLFRTLYTSGFLEPENSSKILGWLSQSNFDRYLSKGIDKNIIFANKYGQNMDLFVYANAGIVYIPNRPYIITVIIHGDQTKDYYEEEEKAQAIMQEISAQAYQYIANYKK